MVTHLPQNQFITNPAMPTTGSAVAFSDPSGSAATAAPIPCSACGLTHNPLTQAVEVRPALPVSSEPSLPAVAPTAQVAAGLLSVSDGVLVQSPHSVEMEPAVTSAHAPSETEHAVSVSAACSDKLENDLEQLIGVAGKRRRRPLALPRFAPDFPELWKAMHDKTAPRTALDPLWADAAPIFLQR